MEAPEQNKNNKAKKTRDGNFLRWKLFFALCCETKKINEYSSDAEKRDSKTYLSLKYREQPQE